MIIVTKCQMLLLLYNFISTITHIHTHINTIQYLRFGNQIICIFFIRAVNEWVNERMNLFWQHICPQGDCFIYYYYFHFCFNIFNLLTSIFLFFGFLCFWFSKCLQIFICLGIKHDNNDDFVTTLTTVYKMISFLC